MKIIKIIGKEYLPNEIEMNSKIIRKWISVAQILKKDISEKYHQINNIEEVENEYEECLSKLNEQDKKFYTEYLNESWQNTFPIMKDVSRFAKVRPSDGVEFCVLL